MGVNVHRNIRVRHGVLNVFYNIFCKTVGFNEAQRMIYYKVKLYKLLRTGPSCAHLMKTLHERLML